MTYLVCHTGRVKEGFISFILQYRL